MPNATAPARPPAGPVTPSSIPGYINVSLGAIEPALPDALRHKIAGALHDVVPVPVDCVVSQLNKGNVTLTVRELKTYAPDLLANLSGHDDIVVPLPLAEIVPQLDRSCFTRRTPLKTLQVPEDVTSVFTQTATGAIITPVPKPVAPAAPTAAARPAMPAHKSTAAQMGGVSAQTAPSHPRTAAPHSVAPANMPSPVPSVPANPVNPPAAPLAPEKKISLSPAALAALVAAAPTKPAQSPSAQRSITPAKPAATTASSIPAPFPLPRSVTPAAPIKPAEPPKPAPAPAPIAPAAPVHRPATPLNGNGHASSADVEAAENSLEIPLAKLANIMPAEVRTELGDVDVAGSNIAVPMTLLEAGLRSGKVLFTWNNLANWMRPPLPRPPSRSAGELMVELPLKVIAPIFMAHHRGAAQKKAAVGEDIPDLFQNANAPEPAANGARNGANGAHANGAHAPAPAPAAAPAPSSAPGRSPTPTANGPRLEDVIGPAERRFSPRLIIQNTAKLPGISGAVVALTDGLPVASALPGGGKPDTVAAFLPQMFGRMSQYTKELGMGALQSLVLNVEGGCWQVFRQPNIYFAVCGKSGEPMPFNLLAQIAAELSRQTV